MNREFHDHPRPFCGQDCPAYGDAFARYPKKAMTPQPAQKRSMKRLNISDEERKRVSAEMRRDLDARLGISPQPAGLDVERLGAFIDAALDKYLPAAHPDLAQAIAEYVAAAYNVHDDEVTG